MSSALIIGLEMATVLGVVVGWGVWELVALRRDRRRRDDDDERGPPEA